MMWSDLKSIMAWFQGAEEPAEQNQDKGMAGLMRLVAASTMASIRHAQERQGNEPYASDDEQSAPAPTLPVSEPAEGQGRSHRKAAPTPAAPRADDQHPPQGT